MLKLSITLKNRLQKLGLNETDQNDLITTYEAEARDYITLLLPNIELTEQQILILTKAYVQYQLFAYLELESLVEDKKLFLDNLISEIKDNHLRKKAEEKEKEEKKIIGRVRVF